MPCARGCALCSVVPGSVVFPDRSVFQLTNCQNVKASQAPQRDLFQTWYAACFVCSLFRMQPVSCAACFVCSLFRMQPVSYAACVVCSLFRMQPISYAACFVCSLFRMQPVSYAACFLCSCFGGLQLTVVAGLYWLQKLLDESSAARTQTSSRSNVYQGDDV